MKKLLMLIFGSLILLSFNCTDKHIKGSFDKHTHKCSDSMVSVSKGLEPYFDEFLSEANKNYIDCDHIYCLDRFSFRNMHSAQGITDFECSAIFINCELALDPDGLKFVVFHEMGHWFGLKHGTGIMKPSYNTQDDREWVVNNWEQLVNEHFTKIRELQ